MKNISEVIASIKNQKHLEESEQVQFLRRQERELRSTVRKLQEELGSQREFAERIGAAVVTADPLPAFKWSSPGKSSTPIVACLKLSDWHIGERVAENETEGFNKFNYEIARQRIFQIVSDFLSWVEMHRQTFNIKKFAIFGEGDYISGDIHHELVATNEFPLPEQTANAGLLLGEVLRTLASHCAEMDVYLVGADNHGRLQKKPQAKQKTSNNMSFLVHTIARLYLKDHTNINFEVATGIKLLANVNGFKILSEHGDSIRGWGGLPHYGFARLVGKEAVRRMNTDLGFHYLSIGHFHEPNFISNRILVNGSLSGTSEFDHVCGRHAAPAQLAFMMHPKHGVFNMTPFRGGDA